MKKLEYPPTFDNIKKAHKAIKPFIHQTPILTSSAINQIVGCKVFFKCENFQKVGAFKMRGATCATLALTKEEKNKGIATHSSGNHAQAVALSAKLQGIPAYIVMPENAPTIKKEATKGYGANIIDCGPTITHREAKIKEVLSETGAYFIPPYNHYNVIAGQGTAAKELIEEIDDLDVIMAPIGGGGLMSGTAITTRALLPHAKIIGCEPKAVDDAYRGFRSGKLETNPTINTVADGLRTTLGDKTFSIIHQHVDDITTVSEEEIITAMKLIYERLKIIIEPSSSVPLASLIKYKLKFKNKRIGMILTGGNIDLKQLPF